jgi:hypothetical protein
MNKQLMVSIIWPAMLFGGASYYNTKANRTTANSIQSSTSIGVLDLTRSLPIKASIPPAVGDDIGFKDGFEPTLETSNFTIYAAKGMSKPALIVDRTNGNVYVPNGLISGGLYSSAGDLLIDERGVWVGSKAGLKGDDCSIVGDGIAKEIKCGASSVKLSELKGDKGDTVSGESCVQGASIYPKCLEGIVSQNIFTVLMSENVTQECLSLRGIFQKKLVANCPAAFPRIVSGSCEGRLVTTSAMISSSEPLRSGDGFQCEVVSNDPNVCSEYNVRVWATCTKAGVDYSSMPRTE